jgi:hypothetical protein
MFSFDKKQHTDVNGERPYRYIPQTLYEFLASFFGGLVGNAGLGSNKTGERITDGVVNDERLRLLQSLNLTYMDAESTQLVFS